MKHRLGSATSTMAMTARHNPGSAFSQARSVFNRSPTGISSKVQGVGTGALITYEKKATAMNLDLNMNHQV